MAGPADKWEHDAKGRLVMWPVVNMGGATTTSGSLVVRFEYERSTELAQAVLARKRRARKIQLGLTQEQALELANSLIRDVEHFRAMASRSGKAN